MNEVEYFLKINPKTKRIIDILDNLDSVTSSKVSGLKHCSVNKLEDLSWAGCDYGIVRIVYQCRSKLKEYKCGEIELKNFKIKLIEKVRKKKKIYIDNGILINNHQRIFLKDDEISFLTMKYLYCLNNQNEIIDYYSNSSSKLKISAKKFIELYEKVIKFIDSCSEIEENILKKIKESDNLLDLFLIEVKDVKWQENKIEL
jgi:Leucine-rich repeat (LRR) protein